MRLGENRIGIILKNPCQIRQFFNVYQQMKISKDIDYPVWRKIVWVGKSYNKHSIGKSDKAYTCFDMQWVICLQKLPFYQRDSFFKV